jgi:thiosulfate dehydrogenase [quinone] large subunit
MEATTATSTSKPRLEGHLATEGRLAFLALMAIQIFIGYEWLMSGVTKVVRGGFPSGLAGELTEKSQGAAGWYKSFLDGTVIPHAQLFGVMIEVGEITVGIGLIGAAAVWLVRRETLPEPGRIAVLAVTLAAAVGAIFMNLNFHLANGGTHPWLIPKDGFDEGVDLDSLLPMLQLVLVAFSAKLLVGIRRTRHARSEVGERRASTAGAALSALPGGHAKA